MSGETPPEPRQPGQVHERATALPQVEPPAQHPPQPDAPGVIRAGWKRFLTAIALLLAGVLATRLGTYLADLWPDQPLLASILASIGGIAVLLFGIALIIEYRAGRRLDGVHARRERIGQALERDDPVDLEKQLQPVLLRLESQFPAAVHEYRAATREAHHAADRLRLFDNIVLGEVDRAVDRVIDRTALTVGAAVAIVPHPALDATIVLWRALVMVRRIASCYGLGPTHLSSLALLRHAIVSAIMAAGMETAGDLIAEEVGRGVLASGGQRLAQTAVTASRLRRLGKMTRQICRPIDHPPSGHHR
ncbi:MAG: DUF697 domain-containing protein [Halothiobacillaceae bacterium]